MVILFTSGTTGAPKGAFITHRAELARMHASCVDFALSPGDTFVAWAPMFHMVSADQSIHALCLGGTVIVVPGFEPDRLAQIVATELLWWLVLMPGMIEGMIEALRRQRTAARGEADRRDGRPRAAPPARRDHRAARSAVCQHVRLDRNRAAAVLRRAHRGRRGARADGEAAVAELCAFRLVDTEDRDVPDGTPGEVAVRGPTLFSGYWDAAGDQCASDFRGGWFHMGDICVRRPDGRIDYVDRLKYMIKSGGENIYPAEIEQVLLRDPRVADAVVVRREGRALGRGAGGLRGAARRRCRARGAAGALCRQELAGYKQPKDVRFVREDEFPRSTTGKIQRHEVEKWLQCLRPSLSRGAAHGVTGRCAGSTQAAACVVRSGPRWR